MYTRSSRQNSLQVTRAGLGFTLPNGAPAPAPGPSSLGFVEPLSFASTLMSLNPAQWFGKGRKEADLINETQDQVMATGSEIGAAFGVPLGGSGTVNPDMSPAQLQAGINAIDTLSAAFLAFLRDRQVFPDGRASGQSANDVLSGLKGLANFGKHATGGSSYSGPHPNPNWTWHPPITPGGLRGALERAKRERATVAPSTITTTAPAPSSAPTGGNLFDFIFGGGGGAPIEDTGPSSFTLPGGVAVPGYQAVAPIGGGAGGARSFYGPTTQAGFVPSPGFGINELVLPLAIGLGLVIAFGGKRGK